MIFVLIIPRLLKKTRAVVIEGDDIKAINDEGELVTIKK